MARIARLAAYVSNRALAFELGKRCFVPCLILSQKLARTGRRALPQRAARPFSPSVLEREAGENYDAIGVSSGPAAMPFVTGPRFSGHGHAFDRVASARQFEITQSRRECGSPSARTSRRVLIEPSTIRSNPTRSSITKSSFGACNDDYPPIHSSKTKPWL